MTSLYFTDPFLFLGVTVGLALIFLVAALVVEFLRDKYPRISWWWVALMLFLSVGIAFGGLYNFYLYALHHVL